MRWFGPRWDAPVCDEGEEVEVPIGEACQSCGHRFTAGERGIMLVYYGHGEPTDWPVHHHCLIEMVTGSS